MKSLYRDLHPNYEDYTIERKAEESVLWESASNSTINYIHSFGVQHRPDFVVNIEDLKIAVELKRGEDGSAIREGIGQSVVYSTNYDFVVYLLIDISKDKKIKNSLKEASEEYITSSLWEKFNIKLIVV